MTNPDCTTPPRYADLIRAYGYGPDGEAEPGTDAERDERIERLETEVAELRAALARLAAWRDRVDAALSPSGDGWSVGR